MISLSPVPRFAICPFQLLQQRLRLLQVFRIKPFGEPVVDLRQQLVSFCLSCLVAATSERGWLPRAALAIWLAASGNLDSFEETRFGFALGVGGQGLGVSNLILTVELLTLTTFEA